MYMHTVQQFVQNTLNGYLVATLDFTLCFALTCYILITHDNFLWGYVCPMIHVNLISAILCLQQLQVLLNLVFIVFICHFNYDRPFERPSTSSFTAIWLHLCLHSNFMQRLVIEETTSLWGSISLLETFLFAIYPSVSSQIVLCSLTIEFGTF